MTDEKKPHDYAELVEQLIRYNDGDTLQEAAANPGVITAMANMIEEYVGKSKTRARSKSRNTDD
jgi:hypothetical protein